jgi:predicted permease
MAARTPRSFYRTHAGTALGVGAAFRRLTLHSIAQDIRYAIRQLTKSPGFAVVAVLTLALGIGANTAIFSLLQSALLRPLPYAEPDRLVHLMETRTAGLWQQMEFSYPDYLDLREHNQSFSAVGGYSGATITYADSEKAEQIFAAFITANFLDVLGVRPAIGRNFQSGADLADGEKAVLLSYPGWQKRFGGDASAIGKTVKLNGEIYTIVGVLPHDFQFAPGRSADFWLPLSVSGWRQRRNAHWFFPVGRLKPGVTSGQAQAELATFSQQLAKQYPDSNQGVGIQLTSLREQMVGNVRPILLVLMGAVIVVLLVTCSNLAALQLARAVKREREFAVRAALGATKWQTLRLLLTESVMVSLLGGALGVLLAYAILPLLIAGIPQDARAILPFLQNLQVNSTVLAFSAAVAISVGVLFGIVPAWHCSRLQLRGALQEGARSATGSPSHRLRDALVVTQVALALVLLVGAGLLTKSLRKLVNVDPGFNTTHLLTFTTSLPRDRYPDGARQSELARSLRSRLEAVPGVKSAAAISDLPLTNAGGSSNFVLEGHRGATGGDLWEANTRDVSPNYLSTMGIPLRVGRYFDERDDAKASHVAIINQTLADQLFPGGDPIGKRIDFTYTSKPDIWQIVGVVADENLADLDQKPSPVIYESLEQSPDSRLGVVLRTTSDPAAVAGSVRRAMHDLDTQLPVTALVTMDDIIADSPAVMIRKYPAYLIGAFAMLALILAVLGIYGLLAYVVAQRTREVGIRLALGAQRNDVLVPVIVDGVRLTLIGCVIGCLGAVFVGRAMAALLFQVKAMDVGVFVSVATLLLVVALLASYIPARRAAAIEPMQALRTE